MALELVFPYLFVCWCVVRSLYLVLVAIWSSSWSTSKAFRHESGSASKCIVSANFGSVRGCTVEAIRGR